ncbi:aldose epimerase family protein [Fredinandcohnia sp. 179-A 10B2 NHS]|uniref:aldose epimerase family protein n=1 Tax=Fredinandcohnia sp. 179-A 10B2 NHS TaxID=3235176 RepID=UPI0039A1DD69
MRIYEEEFGKIDNKSVASFTLVNDNGMEVSAITYGCTITKVMVPDKNGTVENVVLGFDSIGDYINHSPYFGCVVGRVAGRINGASFELDGKEYNLVKNENGNTLHSGPNSFSNVVWDAAMIEEDHLVGVEFSYRSPDGELGFPGNVDMIVRYTLNNENEVLITYEGTTDQKTILNVTNHSYFNLSGDVKRDVLDHTLRMNSSQFLELDEEFLPTGNYLEVENTPFDFRTGRQIRDGVTSSHQQNKLVGEGYDHPFLLQGDKEILLTDSESGRTVKVETDEVSVVVYSSNSLQGDFSIQGQKARKYLGICLETQGLPDAIHHPHFPSITIDEGEKYHTQTKFIFNVDK